MLVLKFHYKTKRFQILKNYFLGKKNFFISIRNLLVNKFYNLFISIYSNFY